MGGEVEAGVNYTMHQHYGACDVCGSRGRDGASDAERRRRVAARVVLTGPVHRYARAPPPCEPPFARVHQPLSSAKRTRKKVHRMPQGRVEMSRSMRYVLVGDEEHENYSNLDPGFDYACLE